ncbi:MAG: ABC transporter permease, partial [Bacteroidia bacterium]|nr:ABC transporter permease [Bacteroidia bacterium]
MLSYLLNKLMYALLTLFGVVTVIFFLFNVLPGDPAQMMLGQNEDSEQLAIVKKKYGFDKPIGTQYLYYLNDLSPLSFHSNSKDDYTYLSEDKYSATSLFSVGNTTVAMKFPYLRESFTKQGKQVSQVLKETLPNTIVLAVSAIIIAMLLGVFLGVVSALKKDSWLDRAIQIFSTLGMSVPSFFSAILFAWVFGFLLHNFTNLDMTGSLYELDDFGEKIHIKWKNLILPAIVLGIR